MKKIVLGLLVLGSLLFAELTQIDATPKFIEDTELKIIDIRTAPEWVETGIVRGSYLITFFDDRGNYDIQTFLSKVDDIIKKDEKFALICRTGSRTGIIADFLGKKMGYNVVNLRGGIMKLFREGFKPEFYAPPKK